MTVTADELADRRVRDRREADAIGRRHPDVLTREQAKAAHPATVSKQCPPHAALLHRVASLITTKNLPPATVTVTTHGEVKVDATGTGLVENCVRRYAAALALPVIETPFETDSGYAATRWEAGGFDGHGSGVGAYWIVSGYELLPPPPMVDRFGVGLPS